MVNVLHVLNTPKRRTPRLVKLKLAQAEIDSTRPVAVPHVKITYQSRQTIKRSANKLNAWMAKQN